MQRGIEVELGLEGTGRDGMSVADEHRARRSAHAPRARRPGGLRGRRGASCARARARRSRKPFCARGAQRGFDFIDSASGDVI